MLLGVEGIDQYLIISSIFPTDNTLLKITPKSSCSATDWAAFCQSDGGKDNTVDRKINAGRLSAIVRGFVRDSACVSLSIQTLAPIY